MLETVGPVWSSSEDRSALLASCYRESLWVAAELGAHTVAFPAISTGSTARPMDDGARIAVEASGTTTSGGDPIKSGSNKLTTSSHNKSGITPGCPGPLQNAARFP